jgi:hypothetical protein
MGITERQVIRPTSPVPPPPLPSPGTTFEERRDTGFRIQRNPLLLLLLLPPPPLPVALLDQSDTAINPLGSDTIDQALTFRNAVDTMAKEEEDDDDGSRTRIEPHPASAIHRLSLNTNREVTCVKVAASMRPSVQPRTPAIPPPSHVELYRIV